MRRMIRRCASHTTLLQSQQSFAAKAGKQLKNEPPKEAAAAGAEAAVRAGCWVPS